MEKHPTSFRLSPEAYSALQRLEKARTQTRTQIVEALLIDAAAKLERDAVLEKLEQIDERLTRVEERLENPPCLTPPTPAPAAS